MAEFSAGGEHEVITTLSSSYEIKALIDRKNHMFQKRMAGQMKPLGHLPCVYNRKRAWHLH